MFDFVRYLKEQYKFDYNFKKLTIYGMDDDIAKIITDNGVMYPKYKDGNLSYSLTSKMFKLTRRNYICGIRLYKITYRSNKTVS